MSLIANRLAGLIHQAKPDLDPDHVSEVAEGLRALGRYGPGAEEVVNTVLALSHVMGRPEGDTVRDLLGLARVGG